MAVRMILSAWFDHDHLEESFSGKEVQFKKFCLPVKTSCPPAALQFKYMNYFIYTYIISLLTGRYELNKMTSLPMCGFIAQLVEHRTGIAEVTGSNPVEALIFFQASSFQLLKLENSLRGSFFTFIYDRSSNI